MTARGDPREFPLVAALTPSSRARNAARGDAGRAGSVVQEVQLSEIPSAQDARARASETRL